MRHRRLPARRSLRSQDLITCRHQHRPIPQPLPVVSDVRHLKRLSTELLGQIHNVAGLEMFLPWMSTLRVEGTA